MISNLVLQDTINEIRNIARCELTIADLDGKVVASTEGAPAVDKGDIVSFAESQADSQEIRGGMYFKVFDDFQLEYIIIVTGSDNGTVIGKLAALQIRNLLIAYKEHFDKDNFIKNLLLDNLLLVDVYEPGEAAPHRDGGPPRGLHRGIRAEQGLQHARGGQGNLRPQQAGLHHRRG